MDTNDNFLVTEAHLALDQVRLHIIYQIWRLSLSNNDQARKEKADRIKTLGEPIELLGKALAIEIHEGVAWIAENTTVVRKLDLKVVARTSFDCGKAYEMIGYVLKVREDFTVVQRP
jgi:hypothetical protein